MGQKARTLVGADVDHIITLLRKAYADEWLAMIQYETAAFQAKGIMRADVVRDLKENAMEEYDHAMKLGRRICELGGTVPLTPEEMIKESNCAYIKPGESCLGRIIEQTIISERCAIGVYKQLLNEVQGKDEMTMKLIVTILAEELEHEDEFQNFKEDMDSLLAKIRDCKEK